MADLPEGGRHCKISFFGRKSKRFQAMRFSSSKPDLPASSKARRNPSKTEVRGLQMWRFLFRYLRHYRGLLVVAMACSALTGACLAAQPLVIKYIVDNGICGDWGTKGEAFRYCLLMSLVSAMFVHGRLEFDIMPYRQSRLGAKGVPGGISGSGRIRMEAQGRVAG